MSRHQQQKLLQQQLLAQQQIADNAATAEAAELFDLLCVATTMRQILGLHRNMCDLVGLRPAPLNEFYPKLKAKVRSWKAQALWKKFDARASHRVYGKGNACTGTRVLVIGAGPCGLRTAIEAQLLGAKVVVLEKRDRITRNNVLHLWPFVITDLRNLGAKKFYGKFCAGSIDHISIRQLQCMLLKVALLLGVEIHEGVSFDHAIEPNLDGGCGWRAAVTPSDHVVSHFEFDVLIGADGKRNMLGFRRKEFRGKLAIAITANFVNKKTEAEAKVEEISGVAFIFNQSFFKELYQKTGIDLENIVYYKDETHYFVMTAKKHSLIDKGVIVEDMADPAELLASANVDTEKLFDYAREAAEFSTKYQMTNLEFAVNHYGKPDVAMFDFTSMFAAEMSCRVTVRNGFRLMQCLVGDSLLEPFWPTGSGCARGFLSSMDAAYAIKLWANAQNSILGVLAQRESIYRLLGQTTPDTLQRDISAYTVDPATRYPNLNRESVNVWQVKHLVDTDDPSILEQTFMDANALQIHNVDTPGRRKRRSGDSQPQGTILLRWICAQLHAQEFTKELQEPSDVFRNGKVLCALISRYRPDLIDFNVVKSLSPIESNELAFNILNTNLHIEPVMTAKNSMDLTGIESSKWLNYLQQICEVFRGEIPHIKHPKLDFSDLREKYRINRTHAQPDFSKLLQTKPKAKSPIQDLVDVPHPHTVHRRSVLDEERVKRQRRHEQLLNVATTGASTQIDSPRRSKKRRSAEKSANMEERQQRLKDIEHNREERMSKRRQQRYHQTQNFYKSLQMLQAGEYLREKGDEMPFEDYSIFLYRQQAPVFNERVKDLERKLLYPDRERGDIASALPRSATDDQFNDRIKTMEKRISARNNIGTDKKPKDLMRAIGKIDSNDWNVREIEKKIEQSKKTEIHGPKGREKVPKWNKEQFMARHHKMSKPQRQNSKDEEKFREIDETLKNLDKQLKEGHNLDVGERGRNKVASIAGQFGKKEESTTEEKIPLATTKSNSKVALPFKKQAASEKCCFCKQTVYLMEKITVEGLILHRGCLKCHHCHTNLRLGVYAFDRDDPNGRFYCTQHYKLPAKPVPRTVNKGRKSTQKPPVILTVPMSNIETESYETTKACEVTENVDLLDNAHAASSTHVPATDPMSDDEANIIDEHEWSGRNFLPESNNDSESDISSSDELDSDSVSDVYEEAEDSPFGAQTLQLATDWIGKQHHLNSDDSDSESYDSSEGMAGDDAKDDTEGEDFKKARERRREEVRLLPLPANLPTDTETEIQSDSDTSAAEVELNSATEISTDSEFDNDEVKTRQAPKIYIDDTHIKKPTKVQIKSNVITSPNQLQMQSRPPSSTLAKTGGSYLAKYRAQPLLPQFKPLVQVDPTLLTNNRTPLQNPRQGEYLLNKTASTEGIASKKSLELKKRYLLGGESANGNKIQKSGSTSVLDSRIRSFQSNISECQKLLNPSSNISASMKTFLNNSKVGEKNVNVESNELLRSATSSILNDLKVEIRIQKSPIDNEKENRVINSKNELNKGMEYSEIVNTTLLENLCKKSVTTPTTNKKTKIECVDLVTPEKSAIEEKNKLVQLPQSDTNKIVDLTCDSPMRSDIMSSSKPDVSKDVKEIIPDILNHIQHQHEPNTPKEINSVDDDEERQQILDNISDEEKHDSPEKIEQDIVQIQVPNIPWKSHQRAQLTSSSDTTDASCSSSSSSIEDIQHFMLDSTTSPDTQTIGILNKQHQVPRVEVHDSTGTLMQVDSLMIVDGRYIGDPEDVKYLDIPEGVIVPSQKTTEAIEDEAEIDIEPITATPEPVEQTTVIDVDDLPSPHLPQTGPLPKHMQTHFKFDSKNENKIESLKNLPLIVDQTAGANTNAVIKPITLNLSNVLNKKSDSPITPTENAASSPLNDNDKTPTAADLLSKGSDSETEATGTGQVLTETELSDWTADDCISENFIDMEFVLNSNRGTIKRNKKERKKHNYSSIMLSGSSEVTHKQTKKAPVAEFEGGILRSIDIDDIEFMDTGSDGSCAEAYSATNTTLLQRNHGYIEYVDTKRNKSLQKPITNFGNICEQKERKITKPDEKLGIDYIEQGAYILQDDDKAVDILKTPVNETHPPHLITAATNDKTSQTHTSVIVMSQSLTDSSTINDIENESHTAEQSEALTIVTSPLDISSPGIIEQFKTNRLVGKGSETPSSSDKLPKSSQSTCSPTSISTPSPSHQSSSKELHNDNDNAGKKSNDELTYREYVRALQQKITQISTACDTIDQHSRKQRRKSSKGEVPILLSDSQTANTNNQTVIGNVSINKQKQCSSAQIQNECAAIRNSAIQNTQPSSKVPDIPTLSSRLEEITKERTKQKDLIHDLVMDKLQSKKQLNAEKRLHRSRQRSLLTSGYASGNSLSPTPKIAAAATTSDTNCTSQAHYHVSTAEECPKTTFTPTPTKDDETIYKQVKNIQKSATYVSPYRTEGIVPSGSSIYKQRPISEHFNTNEVFEGNALTLQQLNKPKPVSIKKRTESNIPSTSTSTENLRSEARARAKLKSNHELGLSPEEKMQLLRKRFQCDEMNIARKINHNEISQIQNSTANSALKCRERKMSASKSVNDLDFIPYRDKQNVDCTTEGGNATGGFTSDPNLPQIVCENKCEKSIKSIRRQKDPERRKSLIQSLSSFFHKASSPSSSSSVPSNASIGKQKTQALNNPGNSSGNTGQPEPEQRNNTSGSGPTSVSGSTDSGGMFNLFRISQRSKEKSKEKDGFQGRIKLQSYLDNSEASIDNKSIREENSKKEKTSDISSKISTSSPQLHIYRVNSMVDQAPPPIPPLPLNYQRSDDESYTNETREHKKQRAISKASRQAELKRLRIAQEIQREQEEIEVQLKDLEARGVLIEKALRGEGNQFENAEITKECDEKLLKELLEIWRNITQLKKRDEELGIRQQELQLEHRHAQLKEELNLRLSCNKLEKSCADVAAEGAILNEMLEIVAKRAALRPTNSNSNLTSTDFSATTSEAANMLNAHEANAFVKDDLSLI